MCVGSAQLSRATKCQTAQEVTRMTAETTTLITANGIEPTYSEREASALLRRSYSWIDQRLRAGQFMLPDGTTVQPRRTPGGYRRFTWRCWRTSL